MIRPVALVLSLLLPGLALAQAPRPAPASPAPVAPALDPAQAASKAAYDRLAEPERKSIQNDLIWTGDFNGVAGGEFGRRTYDAVLAFERRTQGTPDGILAPPERAALKRDADAARAVLRFAEISDQATGIRIGLPQAVLTQRVAVANGVVHRRADGAVSLQLSQLPPTQSFADLFEQLRQDTPGRKVTYRLQRPDWFVVSGEEGGRKFYTRLAQGPGGVRGYTFRYPIAEAATLDRIMIAIANTFEPFPGTDVAANPSRLPAPATPPAVVPPPLLQPVLRAAELRHAISGVALGEGRVMTSRIALASCANPSVAGRSLDPSIDSGRGDAVTLIVPGLSQPAIALASTAATQRVFTLSREDSAQRPVMVAAGTWTGDGAAARVTSALQVGPGGAPVINGQGLLVGIVREGPRQQRMVAGVVAEASYAVIPVFRTPASAPVENAAPSPRLINAAAASLVEIRCSGRQ
ncbi:MAG: peptidoglycan-binding domain-containing protein [Bosea sp. (in: a-proteobacteria)]